MLRAALESLLSFSGAPGRSCSTELSLPAVQAPGANWRARRIVKEINSLQSIDALSDYESELRALLLCQETRQRVKITNRTLFSEHNLEEIRFLADEEQEARNGIEADTARCIGPYMNTLAFALEEERSRFGIMQQHRDTVRFHRRVFRVAVLVDKEAHKRDFLRRIEELERREMFSRRLVNLGRETQLELARRNTMGIVARAVQSSGSFKRSVNAIARFEERDRAGVETLSFLHLSVLYSAAQSHVAVALRNDILAASAARRANDSRLGAAALWQSARQALEDRESRIRSMLVDDEHSALQATRYRFIVGWRDVYAALATQPDTTSIITSIELFERRFVHDEERREWCAMTDDSTRAVRAAAGRRDQLKALLRSFARSAGDLWRAEAAAFSRLHRGFHVESWERASLPAQRVVLAAEQRGRLSVTGEEVRARRDVLLTGLRARCVIEAADDFERLQRSESLDAATLGAWHHLRVRALPAQMLLSAESTGRNDIAAAEDAGCAALLFVKEDLMTKSSLLARTEQAARMERHWREVIVAHHSAATASLACTMVVDAEATTRGGLRAKEAESCQLLAVGALKLSEAAPRDGAISRAASAERLSLAWTELNSREAIQRHLVCRSEEGRRSLMFGALHVGNPLLCGCEFDELRHRLHVIAEAELTLRACAYSHGHDAHVAYASPELTRAHAQIHCFSLEQAYAEAVKDFLERVEPVERSRLEREWSRTTSAMRLVDQEELGRCRLRAAAEEQLAILYRHCVGGARLLSSFQPPPPTGDALLDEAYRGTLWSEDRILEYLHSEERRLSSVSATAVATAGPPLADRSGSRSAPVPANLFMRLLTEMYLSRDALVFGEAAFRLAMHSRTASAPLSKQPSYGAPTLEVHSVTMVVSGQGAVTDTVVPAVLLARFRDIRYHGPMEAEVFSTSLSPGQSVGITGGSRSDEATATLFSTSPTDRTWTLNECHVLSAPLELTIMDSRGVAIVQGHIQLTALGLLQGFVIVDFGIDSCVLRVKFLIHV